MDYWPTLRGSEARRPEYSIYGILINSNLVFAVSLRLLPKINSVAANSRPFFGYFSLFLTRVWIRKSSRTDLQRVLRTTGANHFRVFLRVTTIPRTIISDGNLDGKEQLVTERSFRHRGCNCADIMHVLGRVTHNCVRNDE